MTVNAVAFDIMTLLGDELPLTVGVDLFAQEWGHDNGQEINAQVVVHDVEGFSSPLKDAWEQPTIQILVRGEKAADSNTAYQQMRQVHEFLIQQPELVTVNGCEYLGFEPLGTIARLGRDDNDRMVYSMNYYTYRNPIDNS